MAAGRTRLKEGSYGPPFPTSAREMDNECNPHASLSRTFWASRIFAPPCIDRRLSLPWRYCKVLRLILLSLRAR